MAITVPTALGHLTPAILRTTIAKPIVVVTLGLFSLPHLGAAMGNVQPLAGGFWQNWSGFVGIVLALSGVEAIANATGVMRLDPGSTEARPSVRKTSTPALLWVMVEVCIFTALIVVAAQTWLVPAPQRMLMRQRVELAVRQLLALLAADERQRLGQEDQQRQTRDDQEEIHQQREQIVHGMHAEGRDRRQRLHSRAPGRPAPAGWVVQFRAVAEEGVASRDQDLAVGE